MPPITVEYECLYVHVPFCADKCDYCTFYSEGASTAAQHNAYLDRLDHELTEPRQPLTSLSAIFIGGGTPNFLAADKLRRLLQIVRSHCQVRAGTELTVECNPEHLHPAKIAVMAEADVNRVSLGVQSFQAKTRRRLGRCGSVNDLGERCQQLREHGIDNLSLDLIYGVPRQSIDDWHSDLTTAMTLEPTHLSAYELSVDKESSSGRRNNIHPPDPDQALALWRETDKICRKHGLKRYEISNFARPGYACRHHDAVWHGAPYLGCGPAACSFDGRVRWTNPSSLNLWLTGAPPTIDAIPIRRRAAEILAFGLRTCRGWSAAEFKRRSGFDLWRLHGPQLTALCEEKLLANQGDRIRPTAKGLLFADHIASRLLA